MQQFHHKPIKKFSLDGQIHDESAIPRLKIEYIKLLVSEMRLSGHVPRIDINPDFTLLYDNRRQLFNFKITVYGIYIGKKKSEWILAVDEHRPIYTQKNKSKESSQVQA